MNTQALAVPAAIKEFASNAMKRALEMVDIATDYKIETQEDADLAGTQLRAMVQFRKDTDTLRLEQTRPIDKLKSDIKAEFDPALSKAGEAETLLRAELTRWTREQQRIADEARRAAEIQAEKDRKAAAEALEREEARLATLKTAQAQERAQERVETAQARFQEAQVTAPTKIAAPAKVSGFSLRDNWQPEFTEGSLAELVAAVAGVPVADLKRAPLLRYLQLDKVAIGKVVKAMADATDIPGVRAVNNQTSAVR